MGRWLEPRAPLPGGRFLLGLAATVLAAAALPAESAPGEARLRAAPLELSQIRLVIPLGNLSPRGGHVFPTDHLYLDYGGQAGLPVYAPTDGRVLAIRPQLTGGDFKVELEISRRLSCYVAHLFPEPTIRVGVLVRAGEVLGRTSGRSLLDLGCADAEVALTGFVNPARYAASTRHAVSPLRYYDEPLRTQLYAKVDRHGADKDGRVDYDQPGRLVGNWFHESLPVTESAGGGPESWRKHLAFAYDVREPTAVRVSVGGVLGSAGLFAVVGNGPDPATVGPSTGTVAFELRDVNGGSAANWLLVRMLSPERIRVELVSNGAKPQDFTPGAQVYAR